MYMDIINLNDKSDKLYYVGGIVRDELLGKKSQDIDIVVEGNAVEFCQKLGLGEILQINDEFKTVRMDFNGKKVDFASTRKEIYEKPGCLPTLVETGCSLKDDVIRRDFTVNSLAKSLKRNEIIDYVHGLEDLQSKTLRVLHDKSFEEDPTRIVRGLKFAVRFGFELDSHTLALQEKYLKNVNYDMCFKRLKDELVSAFNLNSQAVLERFYNQKIYKLISTEEFIFPKTNAESIVNKFISEIQNIWLIYLGAYDIKNLPLNRQESMIIEDYKSLKTTPAPKNDIEIYQKFKEKKLESIILYAIHDDLQSSMRYLEEIRKIKLETNGQDLISIGFKPSRELGECLDELLAAKINNPQMSKTEEIEYAKKHFL